MLRANNSPCLTCELPDCPGICDKIRDEMGEVDTSKQAHTITWHGITRTVSEWAEILGVSRQALYKRLDNADTEEEAMSTAVIGKQHKTNIPREALEEAYIRLSTLHLDYILYWNKLHDYDSSSGMVSRYGAIQTTPTNATNSPVERRAIPELNMSEEALYRRAWVACVLFIIEKYRTRKQSYPTPGDRMRAILLEWRAIQGQTLKKMSDRLNEQRPYETGSYTPMRLRRYMDTIIRDLAEEAMKRGLIRAIQK